MTFAPVQAVTKALAVLATVNQGGLVSVREIHSRTGIPKPTVVRLLQTLIAAGYVNQDEKTRGYHVTSAIANLSSGFHGAPKVIEGAILRRQADQGNLVALRDLHAGYRCGRHQLQHDSR